mgnify:FL=1
MLRPDETEIIKDQAIRDSRDQSDVREEYSEQDVSDMRSEIGEQDPQMEQGEEGDYGQQEGGFSKKVTKATPEINRIYVGSRATADTVFRIADPNLKNDVFYAYKANEVAYRIFASPHNEAMPNTTLPIGLDFKRLNIDFVRELSLTNRQIGFSAMYDGKAIRILAYNGMKKDEKGNSYESYIVAHPNGTQILSGAHIMTYNEDLLLSKNRIQTVTSRNITDSFAKQKDNLNVIKKVDNVMIPIDPVVTVGISSLFTTDDISRDDIISKESKILSAPLT